MHAGTLCKATLMAIMLSTGAAIADSPQEFLRHAIEGDNSEMMLGQLAADRASDPRVRDYGRTLADDHARARDEMLQLARRFGVRPTQDVAPEARDERRHLMRMDGRNFDREFIRYMIDDHQKDISDFRDEAREHHGEVSALAARQLPTLRKHLDIAQSIGDDRRPRRGRY